MVEYIRKALRAWLLSFKKDDANFILFLGLFLTMFLSLGLLLKALGVGKIISIGVSLYATIVAPNWLPIAVDWVMKDEE